MTDAITRVLGLKRGSLWCLEGLDDGELHGWADDILDHAGLDPVAARHDSGWFLWIVITILAEYRCCMMEQHELTRRWGDNITLQSAPDLEALRKRIVKVKEAVGALEDTFLFFRPRGGPMPEKRGRYSDEGPPIPRCEALNARKLARINKGDRSELYPDDHPLGRPFMGETTVTGFAGRMAQLSKVPMGPASPRDVSTRPLGEILKRALEIVDELLVQQGERKAERAGKRGATGKAKPASVRMSYAHTLGSLLCLVTGPNTTQASQAHFVIDAYKALPEHMDEVRPKLDTAKRWMSKKVNGGDNPYRCYRRTREEWRRFAARALPPARHSFTELPTFLA